MKKLDELERLCDEAMNANWEWIEERRAWQESVRELIKTIRNQHAAMREEYEDYYSWIDEHDISVTKEYQHCIVNIAAAIKQTEADWGSE